MARVLSSLIYLFLFSFHLSPFIRALPLPGITPDASSAESTGGRDNEELHPILVLPQEVRVKGKNGTRQVEDASHWLAESEQTLHKKLGLKAINKPAKNIIIFLGDGMSGSTITAARVVRAQENHVKLGTPLSFETFPYTGFSKTYNTDDIVADSASTATALFCGVKTNTGTIGVDYHVTRDDCEATADTSYHVLSIIALANEAGWATGIVTSDRITGATPAAMYAHTAERYWQSDADVIAGSAEDPRRCPDIARQLIENNTFINVVMGGGRAKFIPQSEGGERLNGRDLTEDWITDKKNKDLKHRYVTTASELRAINTSNTDYLLGLFHPDKLNYSLQRDASIQPTLPEMTRVALEMLSRHPKGYLLLVEGAKIDTAHHQCQAHLSIGETLEFADAVDVAMEMINEEETLMVVTADHSHTFTLSGYPDRDANLFGPAMMSDVDNISFPILTYANGKGYRQPKEPRYDITKDQYDDLEYRALATSPRIEATHGGDDVGVFARGPYASLLIGTYEETFVNRVLTYAGCLGPGPHACSRGNTI